MIALEALAVALAQLGVGAQQLAREQLEVLEVERGRLALAPRVALAERPQQPVEQPVHALGRGACSQAVRNASSASR